MMCPRWLVVLGVCCVSSSSAAGSSRDHRKRLAQEAVDDGERSVSKLFKHGLAAACPNKTWLLNTLNVLQVAGALDLKTSNRALKSEVTRASENHSRVNTPYGRVVQTLDLGEDACVRGWEYINPFAWLYYIGSLNSEFGALMRECLAPGAKMTIVVYIDEICPGNPLRPTTSRKFQAIYWFILEWPLWLLSRTAIWPCFGIFKSSNISKVTGGISGLLCNVLDVFFGAAAMRDFDIGVKIHAETMVTVKGQYGGTIADEKALKEVHDYKGAAGTTPCMSCPYLVNTTNQDLLPAGAVALNSTALTNEQYSDGDLWAKADNLKGLVAAGRSVKVAEQAHGLKYNESGLLFREDMRAIHKPSQHYIRDWMHILVSGGIANVELGLLLGELKRHHVPTSTVKEYAEEYILPKKYGRMPAGWLDHARVSEEYVSSFASQLLTIMPVILAFFIDCVAPNGIMAEHIACFALLVDIMGLLSAGLEMTDALCDQLADLIRRHHEMYVRIYGGRGVKPKWRQLLHLPEQFRRLRKAISCFAAERKHRAAKRSAIFVFRHLEHTTLASMLQEQCEQIKDGHSLFQRSFLVQDAAPMELPGVKLTRAVEAVLVCGHIHADDVVFTSDGGVARVQCFFQSAEKLSGGQAPIIAQCTQCKKIGGLVYRDTAAHTFVDEDAIVDAVRYKRMDGDHQGGFRIIKPFV